MKKEVKGGVTDLVPSLIQVWSKTAKEGGVGRQCRSGPFSHMGFGQILPILPVTQTQFSVLASL